MSLHVTRSERKLLNLTRVVHLSLAILATLALFIAAFPSFAATPQPQSATPAQSPQAPNATCPAGGQCFADVPSTNPFYTFINRIYQQDLVTGYPCGGIGEPCDPESRPYYRPVNNVTRQQMAKFIDNARRLAEIHMEVTGGSAPIYSRNDTGGAIGAYSTSGQALTALSQSNLAIYAQTGNSTAVYGTATGMNSIGVKGTGGYRGVEGISTIGLGVRGESASGTGVYGKSGNPSLVFGGDGIGVYGTSGVDNGKAVLAIATGIDGFGVYAIGDAGLAGHFSGDVEITGNLSKGGGSFKIDHPLNPANQYLYHSFVESPDMMNVYNGNVTTDDKGDAIVTLPDYFQALNRDFRYQLTPIGQFAQAMVSSEIEDNRFSIKTDKPNVKVSWQVTGIRQDPYANAHRIPVEEDKPASEKGKYLHPTEWGQPESAGIEYEEQQTMQQATESKP